MAWERRAYVQVMKVITTPPESRGLAELEQLEHWFRRKSKVLGQLSKGDFSNCVFLFC